ncbi:OmpA family protein [Pseudomonas yamanorum]|uniref:OmpA family protein n=1 Tax=Pseudomonas yamanorum TaxID=515393 RepID=UPI00087BC870|nr:OmpA family protein [Pseudomonas yamanorum]SDT99781.1 OmpA-OmpF porin, OOP family [Pseudomonas yamanorum]
MFNHLTVFSVAVLSVALAASQVAIAEEMQPGTVASYVFGTSYSPVAPVSDGQAQVVYYRTGGMGQQKGAAHVYVDSEFHTGLLPGGFSTFCVVPGSRTLGAYLNDAPAYNGKNVDLYSANLEGGKTYFLRVQENGNGAPQGVTREEAERELVGSRAQVQALSRASKVQVCNNLPLPEVQAVQFKDYALSGDVLFAFGKSGKRDISYKGRTAIRELITQLHREHAVLDRIEVVGHTDPIGSDMANQALGMKRARTVRGLLVDGGLTASSISVSSAGSNNLVTEECYGSKAEQVACNAPNRRVVVRVDVSGK